MKIHGLGLPLYKILNNSYILFCSVFSVIFLSLNCCSVEIELFLNVISCPNLSADTFSAPELMWQSLLGTALRSCYKLPGRINHSDLEEALSFAKDYKSCVQVLSPVADFLDFMHK